MNHSSTTTRKRAEDATFALLEPEINRIERAHGQAGAVEWAKSMGWAIGAGVKNLAPEYAKRAKVDGRARADQWYVNQATTPFNCVEYSRNYFQIVKRQSTGFTIQSPDSPYR